MNSDTKSTPPADLNRRDFIRGGSLAALMTMLGGVELIAQQAAPEQGTNYKTTGEKVPCAVIGLGPWGRDIVGNLTKLAEGDVVAGCDTYEPFQRRFAGLAPKAQAVGDYKKLLENKDIKAVLIATPPGQLREIAVHALRAGKHVYCEAPMGETIEDAREIAREAKRHPELVFQAGLQERSHPQRQFLMPFIRSGALGKNVLARGQWHKKTSWRFTAQSPEREKEINWRLDAKTSPGLLGEIGIHQLDTISGYLGLQPTSVTGFGSVILWNDERTVPDTVQAIVEYPGGVRLMYDATLCDSYEGGYEVLYGSDAAVMIRNHKAWMFKEVDSPLLGWEVYARKDSFHNETGIALVANATKLSAQGEKGANAAAFPEMPLYYALEAFLSNVNLIGPGVEDFKGMFDPNDKAGLEKYLATLVRKPAAGYKEGFEATVFALKANEAAVKNEKITFRKEWFEI